MKRMTRCMWKLDNFTPKDNKSPDDEQKIEIYMFDDARASMTLSRNFISPLI